MTVQQFVRENRRRRAQTQQELAERAGVGLRFLRDLEQGKTTLRMDKVNQVLRLFGHELMPGPMDRTPFKMDEDAPRVAGFGPVSRESAT